MSRLIELFEEYGQSPWIDNIRRDWLLDGTLEGLVGDGVRGVTSNPSIFAKAVATSAAYDDLIAALDSDDPETIFETLAVADVTGACDVLGPVYDDAMELFDEGERRHGDGYVSLEVSPRLARDTAGTIAAAARLAESVDRPNVMIKIPATREGLPAITATLAAGISVNVTLIFSVERYLEVLDAWREGLELAREAGRDLREIASVASFFVSRVDTAVDALLPEGDPRRGRTANAQAASAYLAYLAYVARDEVTALIDAGAQVQRPLWASTSTKNPDYDELLYVDTLVADETVNTLPDVTLAAARERGRFERSALLDLEDAQVLAKELEALEGDVDLAEVTARLERDGVEAFVTSYDELLATVAEKATRR